MTDKEKLHQILSSLWKNDDSVGKIYYNQALQDVQTAIDLQEEPVSEDLEEAAKEYSGKLSHPLNNAFKAGAKWQEDKDKQTLNEEGVVVLPEEEFERMKRSLIKLAEREKQMFAKAIDADVKVDAGGYPYIPQMELYDYDNDVPLAKEGDKYKVILIKED